MLKVENLSRTLCVSLTCVCVLGSPAWARAQSAPAPGSLIKTLTDDIHREGTVGSPSTGSRVEGALGSLFAETVQDFRRLPSKDSLTWLGIGLAGASIGWSVDQPVSRALSTSRRIDNLLGPGQTIGGARLQLGAAVATYVVGGISKSPKVTRVGKDLLKAQIVSQAMTAAVKMSVRRTRPDGTQFSFPSGHSSVTFASATVLQRDLGWKAGIPAYGVATYVAASRIQEKRHFLSDVAFGAAIGILAGRTVTVGSGNGRFAVAPASARGGGGISLTWIGKR